MVYDTQENFPKRTDNQFLQQAYAGNHQILRSPLCEIFFPCVSGFCLDYMHLVCLGVVRRILVFLRQGPRTCKLSHQHISVISRKLIDLNGQLPSEFARQPRSLEELERWKATEFRQFLLYTGPVVLKGTVSADVYNHFLCLTIAVSMLLDEDEEKRRTYMAYARQLLDYFVAKSPDIYGNTFNVYNIHSLRHLADDAEHFNCSLNELSAFPFENNLQTIKRLVRNSHNPIAQVAKRLAEAKTAKCYQQRKFISVKPKDGCFILQSGSFAFVREKRHGGNYVCDILRQQFMDDFFTKPCHSKRFNIVSVDFRRLRHVKRKLVNSPELLKKVVCLPCHDGYVLMPMLHNEERPLID